MLRKTENKRLLDSLQMQFNDPAERIQLRLIGNILKVLIDISKSCAVIADAAVEQKKQMRKDRRSKDGSMQD